MHRADFGEWGRELSDDRFWQAVAMLGATKVAPGFDQPYDGLPPSLDPHFHQTAEGLRREVTAYWITPQPEDYQLGTAAAETLADAWSDLRKRTWVRLHLLALFDNQAELVEHFARAGIPTISPLPSRGTVAKDWQWPMRFGFLTDARSHEMGSAAIQGWDDSGSLRELYGIASADQQNVFDWLVLPGTVEDSLQLLDQSPIPVRAHCVLLAAPWDGHITESWWKALEEVQARTMASGVVQLRGKNVNFHDLVAHLAHNFPIDEALFRAAGRAPLILADAALVEMSRIEHYIGRLGRALKEIAVPIELGDEAYGLDLQPGTHFASTIAEPLLRAIKQPHIFNRESSGATWAMRIQRARPNLPPSYFGTPDEIGWRRGAMDEARKLQLDVYNSDGTAIREFIRGRDYLMRVWIGSQEGMFSGESFPEEQLPPLDDAGYLLTVSLSAQGFLEQPLVETIFLPKAGESTRCEFALSMGTQFDEFEGRLIIAYQNRILQTYLLTGKVNGLIAADSQPIDLQLEMNVQRSWSSLENQSRVGASLVLNFQKEKGGVALGGYNQLAFSLEGLQQAIDVIEGKIGSSKWDKDEFKGLSAPGTVKLLLYLAKHGHNLLEGVRAYATGKEGRAAFKRLLEADFIQVLAANEGARLPVEFFYSYGSPDDDAKLCPDAEASLQAGRCSRCAQGDGKYVCPAGFWAMQKVIEWHSFDPERASEFAPRSFAIEDNDGHVRDRLWMDTPSAVLAASNKVDEVEKKSYETMLQDLRRVVTTETAASWTEWETSIKASPGLLVLVPHTEKNAFDEAGMEIHGAFLAAGKIAARYVRTDKGPWPVVLLIGCNTDNLDVPFSSFPIKFANAGAAIVVSTISYLLGRHATRLAVALVEEIVNAGAAGDKTFGELMLSLRRKWLLKKDQPPISLSLKAYGDARWRV